MHPRFWIPVLALFGAALAATPIAASAQDASPVPDLVEVVLYDTDDKEAGAAVLTETADGQVLIVGGVSGLTPGAHGIHIHETGTCTTNGDSAFASAGAHYNPTGAAHGEHAGDLGNLDVAADGTAQFEITTDQFQLADLLDADGSALVIHADEDDLVTDPSGNSGDRVVCGVMATLSESATPDAA